MKRLVARGIGHGLSGFYLPPLEGKGEGVIVACRKEDVFLLPLNKSYEFKSGDEVEVPIFLEMAVYRLMVEARKLSFCVPMPSEEQQKLLSSYR